MAVAAVMAMMVGAMAMPAFGAAPTYFCNYADLSTGQNVQVTDQTQAQVRALKQGERDGLYFDVQCFKTPR